MNSNHSEAQAPVIDSVVSLSNQVAQYGKYECTVYLQAPAVTNPYDYDQIALQGTFTGPNGQKRIVDGFFMQDYNLNTTSGNLSPVGAGAYKLRFCPDQAGDWSMDVRVNTPAGTASLLAVPFQCAASAGKGFVRHPPGNYFQFDNGDQYIPIGQNVCWQNNNIYLDYQNWLGDMTANGANFYRLWMASWGLGIEWKNGTSGFAGLKKYRQNSSYYIDWMLDYCAQHNLYMMLCINYHGQYSTTVNPNWSENPYNATLGGPLSTPEQFFTNATARALHKNRLRYIVARWGFSNHILCWELFNEVDLTENFDANAANVAAWHGEMADYLKSIDPYGHLVTTSGSHPGAFDAIWDHPSIDFTQEHLYRRVANIEVPVAETARNLMTGYGKPALVGEFGLSGSGTETLADDPAGIHLHNGLWAGLFSGAVGTAMIWWWDNYVEPQNLYHHFSPVAAMAARVRFAVDQYRPVAAEVSGGPASDAGFAPAAGWAAPTGNPFTVDASGNLSPGASMLGQFLYGSSWNTQYRNPPVFTVTFPAASKFRVRTGSNTGQAPTVAIYLDGVQKINQNGQVNTTYSIDVPAGMHTIKVDNLGTDWIEIAEYVFEKIGSSVNAFALRGASGAQSAGWINLKTYNWDYLKNNGSAPPPADGVVLRVPGMQPGAYALNWWNCSTGGLLQTSTAEADAAGFLTLNCPQIQWDVAFTAVSETVGVENIADTEAVEEKFFPSPAPGGQSVFWDAAGAPAGRWTARFFDVQGQLLKQQTLEVSGDGPVELSAAGLPGGLLVVVLDNGIRLLRGKMLIGTE